MAQSKEIVVPDLGDFENVEIIEILVSAGDTVSAEDGLITLETDKAAMDVPAPFDGVIETLSVDVGGTVSSGDVIGTMQVADGGDAAHDDADGDTDGDAGDDAGSDAGDDAGDEAAVGEDDAPASPSGDSAEDDAGDEAQSEERTLTVPDIGDFSDVEIIEVHVGAGDSIDVEDPLITLETDKAAMDVPAEIAGTVVSVAVSVGDTVSEGSAIGVVLTTAGKGSKPSQEQKAASNVSRPEPEPVPNQPAAGDAPAAAEPPPPINEAGFAKAHASPSVRKLARELGVDLVKVKGSGAKGRVLHDDVKAWVKARLTGDTADAGAALPKVPRVDFAKFGAIETEPLTRIQKISGPRLQASWINLPHVTQHDIADITELEDRRNELKGPAREKGIRLTPLAFVMKACVAALQEFPRFNASLSAGGSDVVYKKYCHLGFAADTDQGLMVPVIRDADRKDVYELAEELAELSAMARDGKLKADQLQGASFTISSLGGIGGTAFTPIVNAPEVAILGVSKSTIEPVWDGAAFQPRLMLPLSLSYDHRVIDGAMAVRFTTWLGQALGDVDALLQAQP